MIINQNPIQLVEKCRYTKKSREVPRKFEKRELLELNFPHPPPLRLPVEVNIINELRSILKLKKN